MREPVITASDDYLFTVDYFIATKQALLSNPSVDYIHFSVHTHSENLLLNCLPSEKFLMYKVGISVDLTELRYKYSDNDLYTAGVLLKFFEQYKPNLVLH